MKLMSPHPSYDKQRTYIEFLIDDKLVCDDCDFTSTAETSGGEELVPEKRNPRKETTSCSPFRKFDTRLVC